MDNNADILNKRPANSILILKFIPLYKMDMFQQSKNVITLDYSFNLPYQTIRGYK